MRETSLSEVGEIARRAAGAQVELSTKGFVWRATLLEEIARGIDDADDLVRIAHRETGLSIPRLEGELRRTAFQARFFAQVVREGSFLGATIDHPIHTEMGPLPDLRRMNVPIGVVAVFGASNFPLTSSVPGGDTVSALAAGCPVVLKAHPSHPETSQRAFEILEMVARSAGAPEGAVSLIHGFDAGIALVEEDLIDAVGFTGSLEAGRSLALRCAARRRPIPFFGELGSSNPLVVLDSALDERSRELASGLADAITTGVGQFCTKPGIVFVAQGTRGDEFVELLVEELRSREPAVMVSEAVARNYRASLAHMATESGVTTLLEGISSARMSGASLLTTSSVQFTADEASELRNECFGPAALIVRYEGADDLVRALRSAHDSLCFAVFADGNDLLAPELLDLGVRKAGRVLFNAFPPGAPISWSMQHGGPWPSSTAPWSTSMGAAAVQRWLRPVSYQSFPDELLPQELQEKNPLGIPRRVNGVLKRSRDEDPGQ